MKTPFNRWDVGGHSLAGALHPALPGRTFEGSQFALLFDRQWDYIATWHLLHGNPADFWLIPPAITEVNVDDMDPDTVAAHRQKHLDEAIGLARWKAIDMADSFDDDGQFMSWSIGAFNPMKQTVAGNFDRSSSKPPGTDHGPLTGTRNALRRLAVSGKAQVPTVEDRVRWLLEGCYRLTGRFPGSVGECIQMCCEVVQKYGGSPSYVLLRPDVLEEELKKKRVISPLKTAICGDLTPFR